MKEIKFKEYHKHTFENRKELERSTMCGCASCGKTFPPSEIVNYLKDKNGETAMCPYCAVDAVIGDASGLAIDKATLDELSDAWW